MTERLGGKERQERGCQSVQGTCEDDAYFHTFDCGDELTGVAICQSLSKCTP